MCCIFDVCDRVLVRDHLWQYEEKNQCIFLVPLKQRRKTNLLVKNAISESTHDDGSKVQ